MQKLLFPDPKPLVERLGREFFWGLPESPGVYLMRDATDSVLYIGKAKSLRKRVNSYFHKDFDSGKTAPLLARRERSSSTVTSSPG